MPNTIQYYDFNHKRHPILIWLAVVTLILGLLLDHIIFSESVLIIGYFPLMVTIGFLLRSHVTVFVVPVILTIKLYLVSNNDWTIELFFTRLLGYYFVAFIIKSLVDRVSKEKKYLISLTATLAESIDARDKYTSFHSKNVAYYSREIAKAMNFSSKRCEQIYVGGLLHDIGKIGVPEAILNKPSRLTVEEFEEFEEIKKHTVIGYNILKHIPHFKNTGVLDLVLHHHEKYDEEGYPHGLKGEEIPIEARVLCVADSFDAMTSKRTYRTERDYDNALAEIKKGKRTQFDPNIADVFIDLIESEKVSVQAYNKSEHGE